MRREVAGSRRRASRISLSSVPARSIRRSSSSRLRLRSRSPHQKRSGTCGICLDEIGGQEVWTCVVCDAIFHVACMPTNRAGHIHLRTGCPACRSTMRDALNSVAQPRLAPNGAICSVCRTGIAHGTPMHSCAAPRWHCILARQHEKKNN